MHRRVHVHVQQRVCAGVWGTRCRQAPQKSQCGVHSRVAGAGPGDLHTAGQVLLAPTRKS